MQPIIIIGTGTAGYTVAREFRKLNQTTPILIISHDSGDSYPKPMLSNALAKGKSADQIVLSTAAVMSKTLSAEIMTHTEVIDIDPDAQVIITSEGDKLVYSKLILAVGAVPVRAEIDGTAADQLISINNLDQYQHFRDKLSAAESAAIIGPGLVGCEFANDLASTDVDVSLIGPDSYPMSSMIPECVGKGLHEALSNAGIKQYFNTTVIRADKVDSSDAVQLTLADHRTITTDIVISATGLKPNITLANKARLNTGRGIVVDATLMTSDQNIFALGDCAEIEGHSLLYIAPILASAKALAQTLNGNPTSLSLPAMPVQVKTPSYPIIISAPSVMQKSGRWSFDFDESDNAIKGLLLSDDMTMEGFVLSGRFVSEKLSLSKLLPPIL